MTERLTDEQLRKEMQRIERDNDIVALRARVAQLEAELKGANLAAEKLNKAYDAACAMLKDAPQ